MGNGFKNQNNRGCILGREKECQVVDSQAEATVVPIVPNVTQVTSPIEDTIMGEDFPHLSFIHMSFHNSSPSMNKTESSSGSLIDSEW